MFATHGRCRPIGSSDVRCSCEQARREARREALEEAAAEADAFHSLVAEFVEKYGTASTYEAGKMGAADLIAMNIRNLIDK